MKVEGLVRNSWYWSFFSLCVCTEDFYEPLKLTEHLEVTISIRRGIESGRILTRALQNLPHRDVVRLKEHRGLLLMLVKTISVIYPVAQIVASSKGF